MTGSLGLGGLQILDACIDGRDRVGDAGGFAISNPPPNAHTGSQGSTTNVSQISGTALLEIR
jgi:hypothetical protein